MGVLWFLHVRPPRKQVAERSEASSSPARQHLVQWSSCLSACVREPMPADRGLQLWRRRLSNGREKECYHLEEEAGRRAEKVTSDAWLKRVGVTKRALGELMEAPYDNDLLGYQHLELMDGKQRRIHNSLRALVRVTSQPSRPLTPIVLCFTSIKSLCKCFQEGADEIGDKLLWH